MMSPSSPKAFYQWNFLCWPLSTVHSTPGDQGSTSSHSFTHHPGQNLEISLQKPFSIYLEADRLEGIIGANGQDRLEKGESGSCSQVMVCPEREGTQTLEIRFLGIPIRRVNLLVEKMPEVIPGGRHRGFSRLRRGDHLRSSPVRDDQERILSR